MELRQLTEAIRAHDRVYAPGSESPIWGDYLEDIRQYGLDPLDNEDLDKDIRDDVAQWWLAVVDHDWDTARATGDIDEGWPEYFATRRR